MGRSSSPRPRSDNDTGSRPPQQHWKQQLVVYSPTGDVHFDAALTWAGVMVCVCLCAELCASTAYGKFSGGAAVAVPARLGWWLLELPVTLSFGYFFFVRGGPQSHKPVPRIMAGVMCWHYCYRGWLFPCRPSLPTYLRQLF
jgi:hypothetical protein